MCNIDLNDNNKYSRCIYSNMESTVVKFESQEELDELGDKNNPTFKDMEGKKRKNSENLEMDLEDSQNSSSEAVKRMKYSDTQNVSDTNSHNPQGSDNKNYELLIINVPGEWSFQQITNYVKNDCDVDGSRITNIRDANSENDFRIRLKFETNEKLQQALKKLQSKEDEGKLIVYSNDSNGSESDGESNRSLCLEECNQKQASNAGPSKPDEDINSDTDNFYIREEYLESLGIKPPITNWVHVTDFRCDKSELKDVLELAGNVLVCSVCTISTRYANVMYSHPLEAVQAVSMLNGQKYYGKLLKVKMITISGDKPLLPKGLLDIGPGLGKRGKPLNDISDQYKRFVKGKPSNLEPCLFQQSLLKRIGVTIDDELYKFTRNIRTPNSHSSNETMVIERSESPIDKQNAQYNRANELGTIVQNRVEEDITVIKIKYPNRPKSDISPKAPIRVDLSVPSPMHSLRGQISRPLGPRVPMGTGLATPRSPGFVIIPNRRVFPNCPPIPGVEPSREPHAPNGIPGHISHGQFNIGLGPSPNPRGPMPGPNRFPGPINTMIGPRTVSPVIGSQGPMPDGPLNPPLIFGPNVQMFKGPDPTMVRIMHLPTLNTNFINLCAKLSEYGQVVFLELTTPGCANVRFATPAEAERCLQNYRKG